MIQQQQSGRIDKLAMCINESLNVGPNLFGLLPLIIYDPNKFKPAVINTLHACGYILIK